MTAHGSQVGVCPHGVDVVVGLLEGDVGVPLGVDEVLGEEGLGGAELLQEPVQAQETGDEAPVHLDGKEIQ